MIFARLTAKSQTTVPRSVRAALDLKPGDTLAYHIDSGGVRVTKAQTPASIEDPFATFTEWASEADCKAFDDL